MVWPWRRDRGTGGRRTAGGVGPAPNPQAGPNPGWAPSPDHNGGDVGSTRGRPDANDRTAAPSPAVNDGGNPLSAPGFVTGLRPIPAEVVDRAAQLSAGWPASDIVGTSPGGDPVEFRIGEVGAVVLVAFLAAACDGCDAFWQGFGGGEHPELSPGVVPVIVTRGPETVAPLEVSRLAVGVGTTPVIMTDQAWTDYRVSGYPFFVVVEPSTRTIIAETVGFGWSDLVRVVQRSVG